jgi:hypothetical protein
MVTMPSEFFGPQNAQQEIADEQEADDDSNDIRHGHNLSQILA